MLRCSSKRGRGRGCGCGCGFGRGRSKLVAKLAPNYVPAEENKPVNERIVESSMHEVAQQAPRNVPNIEQSFDRLAQIITAVIQNQTQAHASHVNSIERVRSLGAKSFNGSGEPPEAELWFVKIERIFDVIKCSDEDILSFATFLLEDRVYLWWQAIEC